MKLKSLSAYAVGLFVGLAQMTSATAQTTDYSSYYKNLPINQPQVSAPVIPAYEIKITDFGGVNDGVTLNTEAFAKAMATSPPRARPPRGSGRNLVHRPDCI